MKMNQLEYFLDNCKSQSLNKSAEHLFLTQPGLTKSIQRLEDEIGTPLFTRTKTGIFLNDAGKTFKPYAEKILTTYQDALSAIFKSYSFSMPLIIYTQPLLSTVCLPDILTSLYSSYPNLQISIIDNDIHSHSSDFLNRLLEQPNNTLLFQISSTKNPSKDKTFNNFNLWQDDIVTFMHINHIFRTKKNITLDFLAQHKDTVLVWNSQIFNQQLSTIKFSTVSNLSILKNLVLNKDYLICLPQTLGMQIFKNTPTIQKPLYDVKPVFYQLAITTHLAKEFLPVQTSFINIARHFLNQSL